MYQLYIVLSRASGMSGFNLIGSEGKANDREKKYIAQQIRESYKNISQDEIDLAEENLHSRHHMLIKLETS